MKLEDCGQVWWRGRRRMFLNYERLEGRSRYQVRIHLPERRITVPAQDVIAYPKKGADHGMHGMQANV